ncbi:MAG: citrate:proton symporter [Spirochaetes bacterium]|nr:citrate:proton symporter [Spirochaetota bacterium]
MLLGILGFLVLVGIMVILFHGRVSPAVAFVGIPIIVALFLGFNPIEIGRFIQQGVGTTTGTAILFIFSIPFFFIMNDVGVFNPIINGMVKAAQGSHVRVTIFTVLLTMVAHLDGAGASTALICIPALLPIYKKLNMRPHVLLFLVAMSAGVMNITPWGGPTLRAAAILALDVNYIWRQLIPVQAFAILLSLALAVFFGLREKKYEQVAIDWYAKNTPTKKADEKTEEGKSLPTWKMAANIALILIALGALVWGQIAAFVVFMIATTIALFLNYPNLKEQNGVLDRSAKGVLTVVTVLLASGALIGILEQTRMLYEMGEMILGIIPPGAGQFYNVFIGFLAAPVAVVFGTDSYFFGLLPLIAAVGEALGFAPVTSANLLLIGHNSTVFVSPFTPAMFLMIGLAGVELREHLRFCLPWAIPISWLYVVFGFAIGII